MNYNDIVFVYAKITKGGPIAKVGAKGYHLIYIVNVQLEKHIGPDNYIMYYKKINKTAIYRQLLDLLVKLIEKYQDTYVAIKEIAHASP